LRVQKYNLFLNWQLFFSIFLRNFSLQIAIYCNTTD